MIDRRHGPVAVRALLVVLALAAAVYFLPGAADSNIDPAENLPAAALVETEPAATPVAAPASVEPPAVRRLYGIPLEGLAVLRGGVEKGDTLGHLLGLHGLDAARIAAAAEASRGVFDVRQLRPGQPYTVLSGEDGLPRHFIYEASAIDYVVFDFGDPVAVRTASKPVEKKLCTTTATVSSSLWQALQNQGVDSAIIISLDEVLGQSVDLFHLQPEDRITLVFEEIFVEGSKVGCGRVRAARMVHQGVACNAFYYDNGQTGGYYDEKGRSVQRRFLRAPLKYNRISSGFSRRRLHPILNTYRPHLAIDYAAPTGTPILAVGEGTVVRKGFDQNAGRFIRLRHGSRYESRYIHLSRFADDIRPGRRVRRGDVIGYVGQTGLATGPHLDFAFYRDGKAVNYRQLEFPRAEPIAEEDRDRFQQDILALSRYLDETEPAVVVAEQSQTPGDSDS